MIDKYNEWIDKNYPDKQSKTGSCQEATEKMVEAFPELTRVRGHFICIDGERPHWWCKDADGKIVDPTREQFPAFGFHVEWNEGDKEPTGICPNCGCECFDNDYCCSENCARAYTAYCSQGF